VVKDLVVFGSWVDLNPSIF